MDSHGAPPRISLFSAVILTLGMVVTTIAVAGFYVESTSTTTKSACHDRVVSLSISNECPEDMFLEMHDDDNNRHYIICHCVRPEPVVAEPNDDGDPIEVPTLNKKRDDVQL